MGFKDAQEITRLDRGMLATVSQKNDPGLMAFGQLEEFSPLLIGGKSAFVYNVLFSLDSRVTLRTRDPLPLSTRPFKKRAKSRGERTG